MQAMQLRKMRAVDSENLDEDSQSRVFAKALYFPLWWLSYILCLRRGTLSEMGAVIPPFCPQDCASEWPMHWGVCCFVAG
jgi:hypothetical protein